MLMLLVRGQGSENTNKGIKDNAEETNLEKHQHNVLGKIQETLCKCKTTTMDEDSKNANMPLRNREPRLKVVECKPRVKIEICHQARKKGKRMDKASITSAFNALQPFS